MTVALITKRRSATSLLDSFWSINYSQYINKEKLHCRGGGKKKKQWNTSRISCPFACIDIGSEHGVEFNSAYCCRTRKAVTFQKQTRLFALERIPSPVTKQIFLSQLVIRFLLQGSTCCQCLLIRLIFTIGLALEQSVCTSLARRREGDVVSTSSSTSLSNGRESSR